MNEKTDVSPSLKKDTVKKVLRITETVFSWLVVAFAIGMMIFTTISSLIFDRQDRNLFGYQFFIVQSDSMSATDFDEGDVVIIKEIKDPSTLQEGDLITFISQDWASFGETVTHKIRKPTTDSLGNPGFVTYGTTYNTDDQTVVTYEYIIGAYRGKMEGAGTFFQYLQTTPGVIFCLLLPFFLVLLVHGGRLLVTFLRWRNEQIGGCGQAQTHIKDMMEQLNALEQEYDSEENREFLTKANQIIESTRLKLFPEETPQEPPQENP